MSRYFIVLFSFVFLLFAYLDFGRMTDHWNRYESVSEALILDKIRLAADSNLHFKTGLVKVTRHGEKSAYLSQLGVQGWVIYSVNQLLEDTALTRMIFRTINILLFVTLLVIIAVKVYTNWGLLPWLVFVIGASIATWPRHIVPNLYWQFYMLFLPLGWVYLQCFVKQTKWLKFHLVLGGLFLLRFLVDTAYISCFVMMTVMPFIYQGIIKRAIWLQLFKQISWSVLMALGAFLIWLLLLYWQAYQVTGSGFLGLYNLYIRAKIHSGYQSVITNEQYNERFHQYMISPLITGANFINFYVLSLAGVALVIVLIYHYFKHKVWVSIAWLVLLIWSWLTTISWAIIAKGHMRPHLHLNVILAYLPYYFVLFLTVGYVITLWKKPIFQTRNNLNG